ncbi:hypothetical protein ACFL2V_05320 [Pseudomonadota bacterium]
MLKPSNRLSNCTSRLGWCGWCARLQAAGAGCWITLSVVMLVVVSSLTSFALKADTQAGFELFLSPHSNPTWGGSMQECTMHTRWPEFDTVCRGAGLSDDPVANPNTKFLTYRLGTGVLWESAEMVTVNIDGTDRTFYHMIVGDLADGFIQESYVEMGAGNSTTMDTYGGMLEGMLGTRDWASASGGEYDNIVGGIEISDAGNGTDIFAADAGNGTANPNRVIVLQINSDGEMFSEFRKDNLLTKPKIYQRIHKFGDVTVEFEMDMSHITYDDDTTAGDILVNSVEVLDPNMIGDYDFDVTTEFEAGKSNVTGGQFTFTPSTAAWKGGADGTYSYASGTYDATTTDWDALFDTFDATGNPWSYETDKPQ